MTSPPADRPPTRHRATAAALVAGLAFLLALPFLLRGQVYTLHLVSSVYLNGVIILGFLLILGYTKQFSLAQVAFYGIGAYATAVLTKTVGLNFFLALPLSGLIAAGAAVLVAIPATRFQGPWLALVTYAFAEIIRILMIRMKGLTGGFGGFFGIPKPEILGFTFNDDFSWNYLFLAVFLVSLFLVWRVRYSPVGRAWLSVGDNEDLAASLGTNIFLQKIAAFAVGSFLAGVAGSLYAGYASFISPESFTVRYTVYYLSILIVGGLESIGGAVAATAILTLFSSFVMPLYPWDMVIFGFIIVLVINVLPQGLGAWLADLAERLRLRARGAGEGSRAA